MLHEVLLALDGHPSPLFPATSSKDQHTDKLVDREFPLLSPSEAALLEVIGKLANLHRQIRAHAGQITSEHPSTVCRAVAWSLLHTQLACFREKILHVEKQILTKDAAVVGAYNIVPLSAIVGEFDDWSRRMQWYWDLVCFIQPLEGSHPRDSSTRDQASGASVIDHLRAELHTGFPDIETAATQLSRVAEKAWLKQVSVWLLYGLLPRHGAADFFVTVEESSEGPLSYGLRRGFLPKIVSGQTANSLLFIGKSLHQVKQHKHASPESHIEDSTSDASLIALHLQSLSSLSLPLLPAAFATTISSIRSSLSQRVLQRLLPLSEIKLALNTFRQIFLLDRGEFAITLISEAQVRLDARRVDQGRALQLPPGENLRGVLIKDGEVSETLARTWKTLTSLQSEELEDEVMEFARNNIRLEVDKDASSRPSISDGMVTDAARLTSTSFGDLLFPIQTSLKMHVRSPLDLFISPSDMSRYAAINNYLLGLRRAHMQLSGLWRLSGSRREHPHMLPKSPEAKQRFRDRNASQRKVWATCSAAVFLLSETTAFFEGTLIKSSWDQFSEWAIGSSTSHDPETLAHAHRAFLASLSYALLLTDTSYTSALRVLLTHVDGLVACFSRLQQLHLTQELSSGSDVLLSSLMQEEADVARELDRARKRVDAGLKDVVSRLRQLDHERMGAARYLQIDVGDTGYEVWHGGGVDRLLMKLDFGRVSNDEMSV